MFAFCFWLVGSLLGVHVHGGLMGWKILEKIFSDYNIYRCAVEMVQYFCWIECIRLRCVCVFSCDILFVRPTFCRKILRRQSIYTKYNIIQYYIPWQMLRIYQILLFFIPSLLFFCVLLLNVKCNQFSNFLFNLRTNWICNVYRWFRFNEAFLLYIVSRDNIFSCINH